MSFPLGSFPRRALAALLAPLVVAVYLLPLLPGLRSLPGGAGILQGMGEFLLAWLGLSLLLSLLGWALRRWQKTQLRHHLVALLLLVMIPALWAWLQWAVDRSSADCAGLWHSARLDFALKLALALAVSTAAPIYRWLAYGVDSSSDRAPAWRLAGGLYIGLLLANTFVLLGAANGTVQPWESWMASTCD